MIKSSELDHALEIVRAAMLRTPAYAWPLLQERSGAHLWVKHENHLPTGAFKVRGGVTFLDQLSRTRPPANGLILATRGNHGQSVAYAARLHRWPVTIVVPYGNSSEKNAAMRALGATLIEHGNDFDESLAEAQRLAAASGLTLVPSFHRDLVTGVATYAHELFTQVPDLERLYVPIGLGSGICGCIAVRDLMGLKTEIIGVQSSRANAYARSIAEGGLVSTATAQTYADGIAVRTPHPEALDLIRAGVADIVEVDDDTIGEAVRAFWTDTHNLAEGAGAAALAAALSQRSRIAGRRIAVVLTGGNIDFDLFRRWLN